MPHIVYLDESGDLGWTLDKPYRIGGSSRYLTITFLVIPHDEQCKPKRIVREVYRHFGFDPKDEMKGSMLSDEQLDYIAYKIVKYMRDNPTFKLGAITVKKERVQEHIRQDENKLYNYMIKLGLVDKIDKFNSVLLIRDNRSVKIKNGNIIGDYLQTVLWFEKGSTTTLRDQPEDSKQNPNLIFIDWISHIVWSKYEDNNSKHFLIISKYIIINTLFF
jgi:hypothetical protein